MLVTRIWILGIFLLLNSQTPFAEEHDLENRIASAEVVFTGLVKSVQKMEQSQACASRDTSQYLASVVIETLLSGSTQQIRFRNVEVVLRDSPNNLEQIRKTFEGKTLWFYGDVQSKQTNNVEEVIRIMFPPCGAKPRGVESSETIMRVIADCYGITGPGITRLPIKKCRNS